MQVNKRSLSEILDVSERSLTEWQRHGLPMVHAAGRGAENTYDTAQVITWMIRRELDKAMVETPKDRLDRIRGDREELTLARELDEVAPRTLFERAWADHILAARTELLSLPEIIAAEIAARTGVKVDPDIVQVRIEGALAKLESFEVHDDDPDEPAPGAPHEEGDSADD